MGGALCSDNVVLTSHCAYQVLCLKPSKNSIKQPLNLCEAYFLHDKSKNEDSLGRSKQGRKGLNLALAEFCDEGVHSF